MGTFIVVLCDSYDESVDAYETFLRYVQLTEPGYITEYNKPSLSIRTDNFFTYIFIHYRLADIFSMIADVIMYKEDFFLLEGIEDGGFTYE